MQISKYRGSGTHVDRRTDNTDEQTNGQAGVHILLKVLTSLAHPP